MMILMILINEWWMIYDWIWMMMIYEWYVMDVMNMMNDDVYDNK